MANILRLARALSGSIPGFNRVEIGEFVQKIENDLDITWAKTATHLAESDGSSTEFYVKVLTEIESHVPEGAEHLKSVVAAFGLQKFIAKRPIGDAEGSPKDTISIPSQDKPTMLAELQSRIDKINKIKTPKAQGNAFEEVCEWFLLQSSYFELGPRGEMTLLDGTEKVDRLLRLKQPIGTLLEKSGHGGYVVLESKFVAKQHGSEDARQITSYLGRLSKYGIAKLGIAIVKADFKDSYVTLVKKHIDDASVRGNYFVGLITLEEIEGLLSNGKGYEGMGIDEFIERSFIQWL